VTLLAEPEQFALEDRLGSLMGYVNAAAAALVAEIATVLTTEAWGVDGVRSPEHFVCWQTGVSQARARRLVAIASRRGELPQCEALFASGAIGEDAMAIITRHLPGWRDAECAAVAPLMTHSQLTKYCRVVPRKPAPEPAREPSTKFFEDDDGRFVLRTTADQDEGALLRKALEAARDDLFRTRHPDVAATTLARAGVTWHEALLWMAELALNALDPEVRRGGRASDRYQVLVHLDRRTADPKATLHLGPVIRDSLARYLACDASVSAVIWDGDRLVGINPRERTVNDRLRKVIEQRDRGCVVPGCTQTRWLHVHHIRHAEDGGLTIPSNLCCLCPYHHRLHHAGLLDIEGDPELPDGLTFRNQHGLEMRPPPRPGYDGPVDQPPPQLGIPNPQFTRPIGERVDWRGWMMMDEPPNPN
jgi:hypothetical protein